MTELNYQNIHAHTKVGKYLLTYLVVSFLLSSCSTYSGQFICGDSRGAACTMLSEVDRKINSGEIEEIYKDKKCRGNKCTKHLNKDAEPKLKLNQTHRALIVEGEDEPDHREGEYLYVK